MADVNTEVNQDKERVIDALKRLRFDDALLESLNEAEKIYRTATTGFELKSSMGHLRSFIENLHIAACQQANGSSTKLKWGDALDYQKAQGVSQQHVSDQEPHKGRMPHPGQPNRSRSSASRQPLSNRPTA